MHPERHPYIAHIFQTIEYRFIHFYRRATALFVIVKKLKGSWNRSIQSDWEMKMYSSRCRRPQKLEFVGRCRGQLSHFLMHWLFVWIRKQKTWNYGHSVKPYKTFFDPLIERVRTGFMVNIYRKKHKCHPALKSQFCDTLEETDVSGVKHGATMYSCIWYMTSKRGTQELRYRLIHIDHKIVKVFKSYKYKYNVYVKPWEKWFHAEIDIRLRFVIRVLRLRKRSALLVTNHLWTLQFSWSSRRKQLEESLKVFTIQLLPKATNFLWATRI